MSDNNLNNNAPKFSIDQIAWTILPGCILNCVVNSMNFLLLFTCLAFICRKKLKNYFNKLKNNLQEYFVNRFVEQKKKEYKSLYNFVSQEYPDVLKEYTEKEIIKHDSIFDFLKEKYPEDENLIVDYKNNIISKLQRYKSNIEEQDKLVCKQCPNIIIDLFYNRLKLYFPKDIRYIHAKISELLLITEEFDNFCKFRDSSYFNIFDIIWKQLRNMCLVQYINSKQQCENPYIKIEEINKMFYKMIIIKIQRNKYEKKYSTNIENIQVEFKKLKDEVNSHNEDDNGKYNGFIIDINDILEKRINKITMQNSEMYITYTNEINTLYSKLQEFLVELRKDNKYDEYISKIQEICNNIKEIKLIFEKLNEYNVAFIGDDKDYINAHKAFVNDIIVENVKLIYNTESIGELCKTYKLYISYHPYDADVFLYDINIDIDNIDNNIQKVFTLYQELCIDVLKIYLSGKLKENNRIDKYMKNISKLYDIINESNNEMLKFKAEKLKLCLKELGFEGG